MRTLLIDNYDSFTYNLFQLLAEVDGDEPEVVRNDAASWPELAAREFDAVVLSPGPGRPERPHDFGVCAEAVAACEVPLLGVCLGHQGIGAAYGARVARAPEVVHGRAEAIRHDGRSPLLAGIPRELTAVRYHSLCVEAPLPAALEALAWSADGVLMALAHRTRPLWGVQFHPESVATEHGRRLLANFRGLAERDRAARGRRGAAGDGRPPARRGVAAAPARPARAGPTRPDGPGARLRLRAERLDRACDPEAAFVALYGDRDTAFWLDSARPGADARFSFIGAPDGPRAAVVTYDAAAREVTVERADGGEETHAESILDHLDREGRRWRAARAGAGDDELPFELDGGFVGYLGYEVKADCGAGAAHESELPDAAFVLTDRFVAFDHVERRAYAVALATADGAVEAEEWLAATLRSLRALGSDDGAASALPRGGGHGLAAAAPNAPPDPAAIRARRSRADYVDDVERCRELLEAGESYEICLTTSFETEVTQAPLELYRRLRRVNPAPFGAYLRFGEVAVLSSSPERFLSVDRGGGVEARPIKGTAPRGATPEEDARLAERLARSAKDRSENLMIADLLRNDLGRVCEIGSVEARALMAVESYETVHQLVTTIAGRLRDGLGAVDAVRACFPPGSMTGAPKLRTVEILDELEGRARGVYSGAIGYLGLGGACDLSVAIRTLVLDGEVATVGAGGAVVARSDAEAEYEEMLLKADAVLRALGAGADARAALPAADPLAAA